jgi:hypothetical protein
MLRQHLADQEHLCAATVNSFPDDLFRASLAIHFGRVDEPHAEVEPASKRPAPGVASGRREKVAMEAKEGHEPSLAQVAHDVMRGVITTMRANGTSSWLKRIALLVLFSASAGSAVSAQTPQGAERGLETTLIPGKTVWITESGGREEKTRIVGVSGDTVTVAAGEDIRRLRTTDVMRVRVRHSDSVLNGALIGAGAGLASGLLLCSLTETWENCRDDVGPMAWFGAIGAGAGIGIDALIRGRRTIYEAGHGSIRLHAAPIVSRRLTGLRVSLSF